MYNAVMLNAVESSVELANLWNRVFGDDLSYVYRFYHHFQDKLEVLAQTTEEGEVVCATHFIPVGYRFFRREHKGSYLYAAMTAPEHRGHNLMGDLLKRRIRQAYQNGELFMCTLPAEPSLYDLYRRFGLEPTFSLHRATLTRERLTAMRLTLSFESRVSPGYAYDNSYARRELTVVKDRRFVEYTALENQARRGLFSPTYSGYFYARQQDEKTVYVKELFLHDDNFPHMANTLLQKFPSAEKFIFDFCPGTCPEGVAHHEVQAGSARLIHVREALSLYASKHKSASMRFSLEDPLIPENTGDYQVKDGAVKKGNARGEAQPMTLAELTQLFMTDGGDGHPYMNMMLD
ncbi:MAG: GNAT family N-acetyltransferase [Clostridiales bacterium]|nr:GNAT family N-acetyltransferase [Clostridiales bacterium]